MSGLLSRWRQRREAVAQEAEEQAKSVEADVEAVVEPTASAGAPDEAVAAEPAEAGDDAQSLPDPNEIEEGGSFAQFLKPDVDPAKRKEALRALWKQPHYNVRDGLCDYDLDYRAQPKLSAKVAAELADKVFRHAVKEVEETLDTAVAATDKKSPVEGEIAGEDGQNVASAQDKADKPQNEA
ncbi:DUF3306 domain-containing protein [Ferrimonas pelagia]|uniref:DUF3306 domain-containing protein n=1 Tax=Ferrimonas pelagia TaxID=1177826 RepID=A0ABP9F0G8_9GAMM